METAVVLSNPCHLGLIQELVRFHFPDSFPFFLPFGPSQSSGVLTGTCEFPMAINRFTLTQGISFGYLVKRKEKGGERKI